MSTAQTIITKAQKLLHIITGIESIPSSSQDNTDCLESLNDLLDSWAASKLFVFQLQRISQTCVVGQAQYDLNYIVPLTGRIAITTGSLPVYRELLLVDYLTFNKISIPNIQSIPRYGLVELINLSGVVKTRITLYPIPSQTYNFELTAIDQLQTFATLSTTVVLPKGVERALKNNLAIEIAPMFKRSIMPELKLIADESKNIIKDFGTQLLMQKYNFENQYYNMESNNAPEGYLSGYHML